MTRDEFDILGDRMKLLEASETCHRFDPNKFLIARLDGRAFHTFTNGLNRPFDERFSNLMIEVASYLVQTAHADLAYTQSDEISLYWTPKLVVDDVSSQFMFDGKKQKLVSVLASIATAVFVSKLNKVLPEKSESLPTFDCRVWQVESEKDVADTFNWRVQDAKRNAISMASSSTFSHKQLQGVSSKQRLEMLKSAGINFDEYPSFFKQGTFLKREQKLVHLTPDQLLKIPPQHRPDGPVLRTVVSVCYNPFN